MFNINSGQGWKLNFDSTHHWARAFNKCNKKSNICTCPFIVLKLAWASGIFGKCRFRVSLCRGARKKGNFLKR